MCSRMDAADEEVPQSKLVVVEYDPVTGIPSEFNDFLPKDTDEFKRLKASQVKERRQRRGRATPDRRGSHGVGRATASRSTFRVPRAGDSSGGPTEHVRPDRSRGRESGGRGEREEGEGDQGAVEAGKGQAAAPGYG